MTNYSYIDAPNLSVTAQDGTTFAYREMGEKTGIPVVLLTHLSANLDNWDPRLMDSLAKKHWLVAFDNKGVGLSSGKVPDTIQEMATDALTFIHAMGFSKVDILSLSMGGMVAQELVAQEPGLVRKLALTGTGPRGGKGIDQVSKLTNIDILHGLVTFKDSKTYLFFTRTKNGKMAAKTFLKQLKLRKVDRDKSISISAYLPQLKAINRWGKEAPADLSQITQPTLIANGDNDRMVPTPNSYDLAARIPGSKLVIYKDAGHVGIFQHYAEFSDTLTAFLEK
ncbi:alpha/beta fold hydrolase [Dellaglioa sp. BT-FLS60]